MMKTDCSSPPLYGAFARIGPALLYLIIYIFTSGCAPRGGVFARKDPALLYLGFVLGLDRISGNLLYIERWPDIRPDTGYPELEISRISGPTLLCL